MFLWLIYIVKNNQSDYCMLILFQYIHATLAAYSDISRSIDNDSVEEERKNVLKALRMVSQRLHHCIDLANITWTALSFKSLKEPYS